MSGWLDRGGYALLALLGAGVTAGIVFLVIFLVGGDGEDENPAPTATAAATPRPTTPERTADAPTPTPQPSATPSAFADPDEALAAFVEGELDAAYIGACPEELAPGEDPAQGICSVELYRSEDLVTFILGPPFSEGIGEAVLLPDADGLWSVTFVPAEFGESLAVGRDAVVFGAGDCLRFRDQPTTDSDVLSCRVDGTRARITDGPVEADDITWWELMGLGWASEQFLAPTTE